MKIALIMMTFFCAPSNLSAQENKSITDSIEAINYARKSRKLLNENLDSAIWFAENCLRIGRVLNSSYLIAYGKDQLGIVLEKSGDWAKAIRFLDEAIHIRESNNWPAETGQSFLHLGNLYNREGEMFETRSDFKNADKSYELALLNYRKGLSKFKEAGDSLWMAHASLNLGTVYYRLYRNEEALTSFRKSASLFLIVGGEEFLPAVFSNLGLIHQSNNNTDSAAYYYLAARKEFVETQNLKNWINTNVNLAALYKEKYSSRSIALLEEADSLARHLNNLVQQSLIQEFLYTIYRERNNHIKALHHLENYQILKDSILNSEFKNEELQVRYQTARQKEMIERQKAGNLKKELALTRSNAVKSRLRIVAGASSLLLLVSLVFFLWRQRLKAALQKQKDELNEQKLQDLERSKKLEAAQAMLAGQEKERIRVAEDLHDRLGSTLVATRMQFEVGHSQLGGGNKHLEKAQNLLDTAITDTRSISHNLISGVLVTLGLKAALQDLKESLEITGQLEVKLDLSELNKLPAQAEVQLYRVAQELANNTLRHSDASLLNIEFSTLGSIHQLMISDNGKGFDREKITPGLGLRNIEGRVSSIEGTLQIISIIGKGTTFKIQFPASDEQIKNTAG